jgi:hypothetical protein
MYSRITLNNPYDYESKIHYLNSEIWSNFYVLRHNFFSRFLSIEMTETNKKMRCLYLLLITLWLFYAPVNLTIFNFSLITLITNVNFRSNYQQI